jgi:hypothetical protein
LTNFNQKALILNFPIHKEIVNDHSFTFNTIRVISYDKKRERYLAQGGRAKIIASPIKFQYTKSGNVFGEENLRKKDLGD